MSTVEMIKNYIFNNEVQSNELALSSYTTRTPGTIALLDGLRNCR